MAYPADTRESYLSAFSIASDMAKLPNNLLDTVNIDEQDGVKTLGYACTVIIPTVDEANVDASLSTPNGDLTFQDPDTAVKVINLDSKLASAKIVKSFDQTLTSIKNMAKYFLAPAIEEVYIKANKKVAALMTSTKFSTNGSIAGGTNTFTRAQLAQGWGKLHAAGTPVEGAPGNLFFATHSVAYGNMMSATEFANQSVVGDQAAIWAQQRGFLVPQFNAIVVADPHVPLVSSKYTGLLYHRRAITIVTAREASLADSTITEFLVPDAPLPITVRFQNSLGKSGIQVVASTLIGGDVTREADGQFFQAV